MKNTKLYSVLCYVTWIGWIFVYLKRDKNDPLVRHHLNQALALNVLESVGTICSRLGGIFGTLGAVIGIAGFVFLIIGIARALKLSSEPLPIIGKIDWIR